MNLTKEMIEKRLATKRAELVAAPAKVEKILEEKYGPDYRLEIVRDWKIFNLHDARRNETENLTSVICQSILILEELLECYATD